MDIEVFESKSQKIVYPPGEQSTGNGFLASSRVDLGHSRGMCGNPTGVFKNLFFEKLKNFARELVRTPLLIS